MIIEHRIIMPDGSIRWQRWSDRAIFDPSGRIVEYQSVGRDVSGQKKIEEALRQNEEKFRVIFGVQHMGIMMIDASSHKIIDLNPYAADMIG